MIIVCQNCGYTLKTPQVYCTKCGSKIEYDYDELHHVSSKVEMPKRKMKRSTKLIIFSITFGILCLIFTLHIYFSKQYDPEKYIHSLDQAIIHNDIDEFINLIKFESEALLDKESYFYFIKAYEWEFVKEIFLEFLSATRSDRTIKATSGEPLFYIKENKHVFGLYKTYELIAIPKSINLFSSHDAEVYINNELFANVRGNEEFADQIYAYPGDYHVVAKTDSDFGTLTFENTISLKYFFENNIDIFFPYINRFFYTNIYDAVLFVNGESTKKALSDYAYEFSPMPFDQENLELHAEWITEDGKILKANAIEDEEDPFYLKFEFDLSEINDENEMKFIVGQFIRSFVNSYSHFIQHNDETIIESFFERNSTIKNDLKEFIYNQDTYFFNVRVTDFAINDIKQIDDHLYEVETYEKYTFSDIFDQYGHLEKSRVYTVSLINQFFKIIHIDKINN